METLDLETLKQGWQDHHRRSTADRSDEDVAGMLWSMSGTLDAQLRRSAWVDFGLKALLLASAGVIGWLHRPAGADAAVVLLALVACGLGLLAQAVLLRAIPKLDLAASSTIQLHRILLDYFERFGPGSALVHAMTAPLFFVLGSTAYLLSKYGRLPTPGVDDLLVAGIGTGLAFLLHFVPLRWLQTRQQQHLRATLDELEADEVDPMRLSADRKASGRRRIVLIVGLVLGVLVIALFLLFAKGA